MERRPSPSARDSRCCESTRIGRNGRATKVDAGLADPLAATNVLVVSDDCPFSLVLATELRRRGCLVTTAPGSSAPGSRVAGIDVCLLDAASEPDPSETVVAHRRGTTIPELIVLAERLSATAVARLQRAGADDVLPRGSSIEEIVSAVADASVRRRRFIARRSQLSEPRVAPLSSTPTQPADVVGDVLGTLRDAYGLSPELLATAALVLLGYQDKEIMALLQLPSVPAAKKRLRRLCRRLGVATRYGLWRAYLVAKGVDLNEFVAQHRLALSLEALPPGVEPIDLPPRLSGAAA